MRIGEHLRRRHHVHGPARRDPALVEKWAGRQPDLDGVKTENVGDRPIEIRLLASQLIAAERCREPVCQHVWSGRPRRSVHGADYPHPRPVGQPERPPSKGTGVVAATLSLSIECLAMRASFPPLTLEYGHFLQFTIDVPNWCAYYRPNFVSSIPGYRTTNCERSTCTADLPPSFSLSPPRSLLARRPRHHRQSPYKRPLSSPRRQLRSRCLTLS
jgi:hypothetical protein